MTALLLVSKTPEQIIELAASRPTGGAHRASGPAKTREPLWRRSSGSRADSSDATGRFVDMFDAAKTLGGACLVWQPEAMLEHPEIVQLGLVEASTRLNAEIDRLGWRAWATPSGREQYLRLRARLDELERCAGVVLAGHTDRLVTDPWDL